MIGEMCCWCTGRTNIDIDDGDLDEMRSSRATPRAPCSRHTAADHVR